MEYFEGEWTDVHGAGAQRPDPKVGKSADYPEGNGPKGDAIRIENFVRHVRDSRLDTTKTWGGPRRPKPCTM